MKLLRFGPPAQEKPGMVDADGRLEFEYADPAFQIDFPRNIRVNYYISFDHDRFANRDFYYHFQNASTNVTPSSAKVSPGAMSNEMPSTART